MTDEEAAKYYDEWHHEGELEENELDNVSGGCGGSKDPDPKYHAGQTLWGGYATTRKFVRVVVRWPEFYKKGDAWRRIFLSDCVDIIRYIITTSLCKLLQEERWAIIQKRR